MECSLRRLLSAGVLTALPTLALAQSTTDLRLHLRYAVFEPLRHTPMVPTELVSGNDTNLYIVQFERPFTDHDREALRNLGAKLHSPLPHLALVVRHHGDPGPLSRITGVRWVGPYHPAYRIENELLEQLAAGITMPKRKYNMVMADKRRDKNVLQRHVEGIGGGVVDRHDGSLLFTAELTGPQLIRAARLDEVLWIDRWTPTGEDMNNARIVQGTNHVEQLAGYTGTGIRGHVYEGVEASHPDWNVPMTNVRSGGQASSHGHATAGCLFGNGTSSMNARGHAPDGIGFYTNYSTVSAGWSRNAVIDDVVNVHNCMLTTASWGNAQTTQYTSISADADDIVFDHRIIWSQSQSNLGNQNSRPEAWAKNVMSIGGVQHFNNANPNDDTWGGTGSTGPASDGRIKPDLSNFYDDVWTSDRSGSAGYSSGNSTTGFGGTSAATPITAGTNAIAIEMFLAGLFNHTPRVGGGTNFQNRPYAQTVKALQIACATPYAVAQGTRDQVGWGYPSIDKMYDRRHTISIVPEDTPITQGATHTYQIDVPSGVPDLTVCMSFLDPAANPAATLHAINDLTLAVIDPSGTRYWGNRGLRQANVSTSGGSSNSVDTVECVIVGLPSPGIWTVEITAPVIAQDAHIATAATDATYALVINGAYNINGMLCTRYAPNEQPNGTPANEPFGSPAPISLPTVMNANQTSNPGSTAFFDLLALNSVWLTGLQLNTNTTPGTELFVDVYTTMGSYAGNETQAAVWVPRPAGHGVAATVNTPTSIRFDQPIRLLTLQPVGLAVVARNFNHSHTTGNGTNQSYLDGNLAFNSGAVTTGTFAGTVQAPEVPNFTVEYHPDAGSSVNQLYQTILRKGQLGNIPGEITGLGFVAESTGVHYNESLRIRMALVPIGYVLNSTFASNMPAPTTVLDITDHSWHTTADQWNEVGLQQPFLYDGASDVVVEVLAMGNHHPNAGGFRRGSVAIPRLSASGWAYGQPPASGTLDDSGLRMRVDLDCANSAEFGTSCGPLRGSHLGPPLAGRTFKFQLDGAVPGAGALLSAGFQNGAPYPQSLGIFGLINCMQWHDVVTTVFKLTDPSGTATHDFPLPNTHIYNGVTIYCQWFQPDPSQPGGITTSNYTRMVIGTTDR